LEERLKQILKKPLVVASHSDADGVCSLVLFSYAFIVRKAVYPSIFGNVDNTIDVLLDGVPIDKEYSNIVIDHHTGHPNNKSYYLVWDTVPTTLIVYRIVQEYIPEYCKWLCVPGLVGDGAADLIPSNIWDMYPELFYNTVKERTGRYGRYEYDSPVWQELSVLINAACRCVSIGPIVATKLLKQAKSPLDIVYNETLALARSTINEEMTNIFKDIQPIDTGKVIYAEVESENKVEGLTASRLISRMSKRGRAAVVVNKTTGNVSVRGILATWVADKLNKLGYNIAGHPSYKGSNIDIKQIKKFKSDVIALR